MEAYLLTGLAMCLILVVALVATAYLAVYFNRRGKADLESALAPLARAIDGTVDLEDAQVSGRWEGYPVYARMANASEGPGRVFQADVVDSAGGTSWQYTSNPVTTRQQARSVEFSGPEALRSTIEPAIEEGMRAVLEPDHERYRVEYRVEDGIVRLIRAMRTRRDIPDVAILTEELSMLVKVAMANRTFMQAPAASEARR
jgi:hypothetical protein